MLDQSAQKNETEAPRSRLMFELATKLEDILELRDLAKLALEESRFNKAKFSDEKFVKAANLAARDSQVHGVLTAQFASKPVGFLYCQVGEPMVAAGMVISTVQSFYVSRTIRASLLGGRVSNGLLNGALSWSKSRKAEELMVHATSGISPHVINKYFPKRGFLPVGGTYVRSLN